ncbi:hypothetical protein [Brytella acorum]|uniref:Uncharacterized protein n=1 Tax=Brytella acorum TaxID=2959299 RepID=A0AA35UWV6_9PROT|nr:hypothetical protein [Brytella acorum]MDF3624289.1 hypothetical protein [Brytella acorum]CAI9121137.1 hypothetical protein LMG32879_001983 [Brytella acorum]
MTIALSILLWTLAFLAHTQRQPRILRLLGQHKAFAPGILLLVSILLPAAALGACLAAYGGVGLEYWIGTMTLGGVIAAMGLTVQASRSEHPSKQP